MRVIEYVKNIAENFPLSSGGSLSAAQFLQLFLFEPDKQYSYISTLSGGEKRRLQLLTILFKNPNFLILDEPTNDLDLPTLAVLENFLEEFAGCLVIVSHDRYFMDRLTDHLFVFKGDGVIEDFPGNYADYRMTVKEDSSSAVKQEEKKDVKATANTIQIAEQKKRMSYKEKREFDLLEGEITALRKEKQELEFKLSQAQSNYQELSVMTTRIGEIDGLIDEKEMRWLELSEYEG
jgi:ATP-binding cassette subfamily F protein uup